MPKLVLQSTITCPNCGSAKTEMMPTDVCRFFYNCANCGARLKPKSGDCCVFCSYGDVPCPPVQEAGVKNDPCYLPMYSEKNYRSRSVMTMILGVLALLAAGGTFCIFCL